MTDGTDPKAWAWKAANMVRFLEHLDMTLAQKQKFVARELADAFQTGIWSTIDSLKPVLRPVLVVKHRSKK